MSNEEKVTEMKEYYLDNCSTTPCHPEVLAGMYEILSTAYGNPGSLHEKGWIVEKKIKEARAQVANLLHTESEHVFFTSTGSEGNNWAIYNGILQTKHRNRHMLSTTIDHPSVIETLKHYESMDYRWTKISVKGTLSETVLQENMDEDISLVVLSHVNSELGTVNDIEKLSKTAKTINPQVYIHVDGVQSFGKLPIDVKKWDIDSFTVSAHKIHGPKGIGANYFKDVNKCKPLLHGGGQEFGKRAGTENVAGIVGMGIASELASKSLEQNHRKVLQLRRALLSHFPDGFGYRIHGEGEHSPYVINMAFDGIRGEVLLHLLEEDNIYISTGSACSSKSGSRSHVLEGIGLQGKEIDESIRICLSPDLEVDDMEYIGIKMKQHIESIREVIK